MAPGAVTSVLMCSPSCTREHLGWGGEGGREGGVKGVLFGGYVVGGGGGGYVVGGCVVACVLLCVGGGGGGGGYLSWCWY